MKTYSELLLEKNSILSESSKIYQYMEDNPEISKSIIKKLIPNKSGTFNTLDFVNQLKIDYPDVYEQFKEWNQS